MSEMIAMVAGGCLLTVLLLFFVLLVLPKLRHRNFPGPHYYSFILGNTLDFVGRPGQGMVVLEEYRDRYGKTFQIWMLSRRCVVITDPEDIKHILATKALPKPERFNAGLAPLTRDGLVTTTEERHKAQRRAISGRFNEDFLRSLHKHSAAALGDFSAILGDAAEKGAVIDLDEMLTRLTLDVILRCAFGAEVGKIQSADASNKHPLPLAITVSLEECYRNLILYPLRAFHVAKPLRKATQFIHEFCLELVNERRANPKSGDGDDDDDDLLDILMSIPGATDDYIVGEVVTFLIAGHDTTSHTLSFMFYELCKQPEIKEKMLAELDTKMTDAHQTIPAFKDIAAVSYIRAVWKETLRLHPAAATGTMRIATEDIYLPASKLTVEKGTELLVPPFVVGHSEDLWPEAHSFKPERFLNPTARPHPYAFQTFSAGHRNCIGQFFATHEAVTIIMSTLRQFDIELACRPEEVTQFHATIMRPRVPNYAGRGKDGPPMGLPVRVKKRL
eukprot:CAMPEP_0174885144 /NCGR_PEP_ID=MMETSP0167-20121228/509_1 /TAXON_ID=38298 /ORGANISM="Rhodella maculata, Strain CCMP736" /LENGTH=502 /DNA_ID=CAMNT_0016120657 /DNA_START=125 /DNA_END=1633 /DNA_ORIENTATION=-